jgi:hypothetical protein
MTSGVYKHNKHSEETKRKIAEADKRNGNKPPSQKGKKRSKETLEKRMK